MSLGLLQFLFIICFYIIIILYTQRNLKILGQTMDELQREELNQSLALYLRLSSNQQNQLKRQCMGVDIKKIKNNESNNNNKTNKQTKNITKTCLYNVDSFKPHFYIVKRGFTGVYIILLISAQNIDCGYVRTASPRRF